MVNCMPNRFILVSHCWYSKWKVTDLHPNISQLFSGLVYYPLNSLQSDYAVFSSLTESQKSSSDHFGELKTTFKPNANIRTFQQTHQK